MNARIYKKLLTFHAVPFVFLCISLLVSVLLLVASFMLSWSLWVVGLLVLAAWTPLVVLKMKQIYVQSAALALLFVLVVSQSAHFLEHTSQMVQMHLMGLTGPRAGGVISVLNTEWVHFLWNTWVLILATFLMMAFRKNVFLWILFLFAIYHELEHIQMMSVYLNTGVQGSPGFLARGGLFFGGLPLSRPDVHFFYAVFEEALLLMGYFVELRRIPALNAVDHPPLALQEQ